MFKQTAATKLMAPVFWDRKGMLMVEFMQQGTSLMSEMYCKTLKKPKMWIANILIYCSSMAICIHI
jgi:hypothetical protein